MKFKENESATKLRGGYYTDPAIANYLLRWVLQSQPKNLLEPSCGDGVFFRCLHNFDISSIEEVFGFEIEPREVEKSKKAINSISGIKSKIQNFDFLEWVVEKPIISPQFDAIVGNPPFIRYQYLEDDQQKLAEAIFRRFSLRFTKHTNAWVPFVVSSIALLNPGGRLAMVLPSELLHVLHAESLRTFLTAQCSKILIIDPQELWFEKTLQGAILLLAERKRKTPENSHGVGILPTRSRSILEEDPDFHFSSAEFVNGDLLSGKWMKALLTHSERELLKKASSHQNVLPFDDIAKVAVGIVTGANKFFLVPDEVVDDNDLSAWAFPMFGRSEHVPGVVYDKKVHEGNKENGNPTNFLWFRDERFGTLPLKVRQYIKLGETQNIHQRYKCRIREPWYGVPSVYSTEVSMLKRSHNFPRLIFNKLGAYTTDTAYRIKSVRVSSQSLVFSFINSLTVLSAELEGRHYGGGVLELVPSEIRKLLIPIVDADEKDVYKLDEEIRRESNPEKILRKQDARVLEKVGLSTAESGQLRKAWTRLRLRRQRKV